MGRGRGFPRPGAAAALLLVTAIGIGTVHAAEVERLEVGLTAAGEVIEALRVAPGRPGAARVAVVGGLAGRDATSRAVTAQVEAYAARADAERAVELLAVPVANPRASELVFPPTGAAYVDHPESHALWRWLGLRAPDLVLVAGDDAAGLAETLSTTAVAGVASIPARRVAAGADLLAQVAADPSPSPARVEIENRRARTPLELASALGEVYGHSFDPPIYIFGMALIGHLRLGHVEHVERLVAPYVDGTRSSLGERRFGLALTQAGHLVFAELAARTGEPAYLERARAAADFAFTDDGRMREAMPDHGDYSDSIFMGASILAAVGELTGEGRYFDMAARHIAFMNERVRRDDDLYRHWPATDAAWARGNGFAALGYALTLSAMPGDHAARERLLNEYRALMTALVRRQNPDGTWREVVDHPGAYHETSATAIIGFAIERGLRRGWLDDEAFAEHADRAWQAVLTRTDSDGGFIDVCESTPGQPSLAAYLEREALAGMDPRTGGMVMLFAAERAGLD